MKCRVCDSPLPEGAMFCGECGSAVSSASARPAADPRPSDTTVIRPRSRPPVARPAVAGPASVSTEVLEPDAAPATGGEAAAAGAEAAPTSGVDPAGSGAAPTSEAGPAGSGAGPASASGAAPASAASAPASDVAVDAAAASVATPEPVILSISTGERVTVTTGGLLGRRPVAQPGEEVGMIVQVTDPGRTVSKTHFEFGFDDGWFWICDRYSGNGTVLQPPTGRARLCEPGHRYRVPRGSRIEIGDQHIDVA